MKTDKKIKAIIFDLGNVLIKVDFERMLINQTRQNPGSTAHEIMEAAYNDDLFKNFCKGEIDPLTFYKKLIQRFDLTLSYNEFREKWCDIFEPDYVIAEFVHDLSKKYKIGLLSDTDPIHWEYVLEKFTFLQSIKNPTLSFKTGYMKPHPEIYRIAAKNLNCPLTSCLFIDDRAVNVEGAINTGMTALQFQNIESLKINLQHMRLL